ncbi:MAG: hypothetical protein IKE76_05500 [Clostridia bacterium]|nr:hypothetical protein [Clostridia bacterium]
MKILSREFTTGEKVLILMLVLILLGLMYYYFVDMPVRNAIISDQAELDTLQSELDAVQNRLSYLTGIRKNLDELQGDNKNLGWMGSYNNSEAEVRFLNDVLATTMKYNISFANVTRDGNQIRRNFSLRFQTADYLEAQDVITRLLRGENRCLMGDMKCNVDESGTVTIDATATFYETMVDGVEDAVLPNDSAHTK